MGKMLVLQKAEWRWNGRCSSAGSRRWIIAAWRSSTASSGQPAAGVSLEGVLHDFRACVGDAGHHVLQWYQVGAVQVGGQLGSGVRWVAKQAAAVKGRRHRGRQQHRSSGRLAGASGRRAEGRARHHPGSFLIQPPSILIPPCLDGRIVDQHIHAPVLLHHLRYKRHSTGRRT